MDLKRPLGKRLVPHNVRTGLTLRTIHLRVSARRPGVIIIMTKMRAASTRNQLSRVAGLPSDFFLGLRYTINRSFSLNLD